MLPQFTIEDFNAWQLRHYTERLAEAKTLAMRIFLRDQLFRLKKAYGTNHRNTNPAGCLVIDLPGKSLGQEKYS